MKWQRYAIRSDVSQHREIPYRFAGHDIATLRCRVSCYLLKYSLTTFIPVETTTCALTAINRTILKHLWKLLVKRWTLLSGYFILGNQYKALDSNQRKLPINIKALKVTVHNLELFLYELLTGPRSESCPQRTIFFLPRMINHSYHH